MDSNNMVPAQEFCTHHSISYTFITGLQEAGLVEVVLVEEQAYLYTDQLAALEKLVRMHTELEINMEGVEAVAHLLQRLETLQLQLHTLSQRLLLYEDREQV
jgi:chaperone modulatory protein CbpM